jgi:hypothetical protein
MRGVISPLSDTSLLRDAKQNTLTFAAVDVISANRYGDWLRAGRSGLYSRQGQQFFLLHSGQAGSGAHAASYPMGTRTVCPGVKLPVLESYHSHLLHKYPYVFIVWFLIKHREGVVCKASRYGLDD